MYGISAFILDYQQYIYIPNRYILCRWRRKKIGYRLLIDNAIEGKDIEIWGDKTRKKIWFTSKILPDDV